MEEQEFAEGGRGGGRLAGSGDGLSRGLKAWGWAMGKGRRRRPAGGSPFTSCQEPMEEAVQRE